MPFYLFSMRLVAKDKFGQEISDKLQQFVRQIDNRDIDNVWRQYKKKAESHYGKKMRSFAVVQLSKLDPRSLEFVDSQAKRKEDNFLDIFNDPGDVSIAPATRKRKGLEGGEALGERNSAK